MSETPSSTSRVAIVVMAVVAAAVSPATAQDAAWPSAVDAEIGEYEETQAARANEKLVALRRMRGLFGVELTGWYTVPEDVIGGPHARDTAMALLVPGVFGGVSFALGPRFELRLTAVVRYAPPQYVGWDCGQDSIPDAERRITSCTGTWQGLIIGTDAVLRVRPVSPSSAWYLGVGTEIAAHIAFGTREWDAWSGGSAGSGSPEHHSTSADQTTAQLGLVLETGAVLDKRETVDLGARVTIGRAGRGVDEAYSAITLFFGGVL